MNDPNGMVFYKGEYHLFYQYNPEGQVWGHMSWGHAVSTDMVHWKHLPLAIPEDPNYMIYSGSAVVDWNNSSGLCKNPDPQDHSCLIAIYAAAYKDRQKQHIAYSNDRGRTWTNYAGNPVIDVDAEDFRDPKVFWYAPQKKWVLVAVLADQRKALFFSSTDLKHWTKMSEFGPAGDDAGSGSVLTCSSLPIEGTKEHALGADHQPQSGRARGRNGRALSRSDTSTARSSRRKRARARSCGPTTARTSTPPTRSTTCRRAMRARSGWAGPATGSMRKTSPRCCGAARSRFRERCRLRRVGDQLLMVQAAGARVAESARTSRFASEQLRRRRRRTSQDGDKRAQRRDLRNRGRARAGGASEIGFRLRKGDGVETLVGVVPATNTLFVDRTKSGDVSFSKDFPGTLLHDAERYEAGEAAHLRGPLQRGSVCQRWRKSDDRPHLSASEQHGNRSVFDGRCGKICVADGLAIEAGGGRRQVGARAPGLARTSETAAFPSEHMAPALG